METMIPKTSAALSSLLRADFTTQWRNRRSTVLILLVPVIILISWKGVIDKLGPTFALSTCITLGLIAVGLMGYSNAIARDRDKGVFQRLRVTPVPAWSIMVSRLIVQLAMIVLVTAAVFIAGFYIYARTVRPVRPMNTSPKVIFPFLETLITSGSLRCLSIMACGVSTVKTLP